MTPLAWLALALASGVAAYVIGSPVLRGRRTREARDLNAERYLAWRGRARPPSASRPREGLTADERRRLLIAAVLALLAAAAMVAFFATS